MASNVVTREMLRKTTHLSDLTLDALSKLASIAEERIVPRGTHVFSDMDPAERLFLVVRGEVNLCCEMGSGELRVMDSVADGELFAWSALVEPYRYTSTAVAASDTVLVAFDATKLREMCEVDVDLGSQLLNKVVQLLSNRLESVRVQLAGA